MILLSAFEDVSFKWLITCNAEPSHSTSLSLAFRESIAVPVVDQDWVERSNW